MSDGLYLYVVNDGRQVCELFIFSMTGGVVLITLEINSNMKESPVCNIAKGTTRNHPDEDDTVFMFNCRAIAPFHKATLRTKRFFLLKYGSYNRLCAPC